MVRVLVAGMESVNVMQAIREQIALKNWKFLKTVIKRLSTSMALAGSISNSLSKSALATNLSL